VRRYNEEPHYRQQYGQHGNDGDSSSDGFSSDGFRQGRVLYSVSASPVKLISSKSRVYSLNDCDLVGLLHGEAVGGILIMDSSVWSNVLRHHTFDTSSDTEFENNHSAIVEYMYTTRMSKQSDAARLER